MSHASVKRVEYTRAEYLSDLAVHVTGLLAAIAAVPVLIVVTAMVHAGDWSVTGTAIYGASLIAMIGCSALYNIFPHPEWEWLLKRLDHSAIFFKIAGTYTAFVLIAGQGFALAGALWAAAVAGISLKIACPFRWPWVSLGLYLGMGWLGVVAGWGLFAALPGPVVALVASGGLLYTVGVIFYLWDRLPYHNTIWHLFVLVASFTIYAGLVVAVVA